MREEGVLPCSPLKYFPNLINSVHILKLYFFKTILFIILSFMGLYSDLFVPDVPSEIL
jgi:hypothetical protein